MNKKMNKVNSAKLKVPVFWRTNLVMQEGNQELVAMLHDLADSGDYDSQVNLANMYREGQGVDANEEEMIKYALMIVNHDFCESDAKGPWMNDIGCYYHRKKDLKQAIIMFEGAEMWFVDQHLKDLAFTNKISALKDLELNEECELLYTIVITRDPPFDDKYKKTAYRWLGARNCVKKDYANALELYMMTYKLGDRTYPLLNNIGYMNELLGSHEKAVKFYRMAVLASSDKDACFGHLNLAYMFENGLGVYKDIDEAKKYYEMGKDCLEEWKEARKNQ